MSRDRIEALQADIEAGWPLCGVAMRLAGGEKAGWRDGVVLVPHRNPRRSPATRQPRWC